MVSPSVNSSTTEREAVANPVGTVPVLPAYLCLPGFLGERDQEASNVGIGYHVLLSNLIDSREMGFATSHDGEIVNVYKEEGSFSLSSGALEDVAVTLQLDFAFLASAERQEKLVTGEVRV